MDWLADMLGGFSYGFISSAVTILVSLATIVFTTCYQVFSRLVHKTHMHPPMQYSKHTRVLDSRVPVHWIVLRGSVAVRVAICFSASFLSTFILRLQLLQLTNYSATASWFSDVIRLTKCAWARLSWAHAARLFSTSLASPLRTILLYAQLCPSLTTGGAVSVRPRYSWTPCVQAISQKKLEYTGITGTLNLTLGVLDGKKSWNYRSNLVLII